MLRLLFIVCAVITTTVSRAQYWVADGHVVHPEQIIFDYQADENDKKEWFEDDKKYFKTTESQKAYLIKKLRAANHGEAFREKTNYAAENSAEWQKLRCRVIRLFKNKKYGKETLALFYLRYSENCTYGYEQRSELLKVETDEYFVAPVTALESYLWPKGNIPKQHYRENGVHEIKIMAAQRPDHYGRKYLRTNLTYFDPKNFSDSTLSNLRRKLNDDDLYYEVLEMGQLDNTYHTYNGSRIFPMVKFDPNGRGTDLLITYSMGEFTSDKGETIELVYAPNIENDEAMNKAHFSDYRGSTNGSDCYYFVLSGTADDIGRGNTIDYALARIFRKINDKFNGWDIPLRGYFQKLKGYCCLGYETAKDYGVALITEDRTSYFLNSGSISTRELAEEKFNAAIKDLDNVDIIRYGKLKKGPLEPEKVIGDVSVKYQLYKIIADGKEVAVNAMLVKFRDDFYLVGIEVLKVE